MVNESNSTVISIVLKQTIMWPRPTFLQACDVNQKLLSDTWASPGFVRSLPRYVTLAVCQAPDKDVLRHLNGLPSNTIATAFAVGTFLTWYIGAKFSVLGPQQASLWSLLFTLIPFFGATIWSGVPIRANSTTPAIALFSAFLGIVCALLTYRIFYTSVFDVRHNFLPRDRGNSAWVSDPRQFLHLKNRKWEDDAPWLAVNTPWQIYDRSCRKPYVRRSLGGPDLPEDQWYVQAPTADEMV